MVLESLIPVSTAEKKPLELLPLSILYGSVGILLALWIFPNDASLAVVFFTIMALLPLMVQVMSYEEAKGAHVKKVDIKHHRKVIPFFIWMFVGLVIAYTVWATILPNETSSELFKLQIGAINKINENGAVSGEITGSLSSSASGLIPTMTIILSNNLRVLAFSILFSFIYGAGAIFILTWNATVISVAIANGIRSFASAAAATLGSSSGVVYFQGFGLAMMRYLIHGIPEILGYFIGGLAGGIISFAIIKHRFESETFKRALIDAFDLTLLAIFILFIAAILEVGVSPLVPI